MTATTLQYNIWARADSFFKYFLGGWMSCLTILPSALLPIDRAMMLSMRSSRYLLYIEGFHPAHDFNSVPGAGSDYPEMWAHQPPWKPPLPISPGRYRTGTIFNVCLEQIGKQRHGDKGKPSTFNNSGRSTTFLSKVYVVSEENQPRSDQIIHDFLITL